MLLDGYITFGIPEESRDVKQILAGLKIAAWTLDRCIGSLNISQTDKQESM